MPSVSPIIKSPVAQYLIANRAISKRIDGICHFFSPEGMYLGKQFKENINGVNFFTTVIYGENFQPLMSKNVVLATVQEYFKDKNVKLGIVPIIVSKAKKVFNINYLLNKYDMVQSEKVLSNKIDMIAMDEEGNIGLYKTQRPYRYKTNIVEVVFGKTYDECNSLKFSLN